MAEFMAEPQPNLIPESAFSLDEVGRPGEPFFDAEEWVLTPAGVWTRPARVEAEQKPTDYREMADEWGWGMMGNGPLGDDALSWRAHERVAFSVTDPRAQVIIAGISEADAFIRDLVLVVEDPAERWAQGWREFGRQLVDIVRHEVAIARGVPASSPGARWVTAESQVNAPG